MPKLIYHDSDGVDKSFNLSSEPVLIGRATECQIQTQDAMVSRRHARISWEGGYVVEDLGSSNGVYVGHDKVQRAPFRPGDVVTCGSLVIRMMPDTQRPSTTSMQPQGFNSAQTGPQQIPQHLQQNTPAPRAPQPQMATMAPQAQQHRTPPVGNEVRSGRTPPVGAPSLFEPGDLAGERKRREEAESAVLSAAQRVQEAETEAALLKRRVADLEQRLAQGGGGDSAETDKLRRQVDQMTADLRRMRAGGADAGLAEQLKRVEAERDQLRTQLAQASSRGGVDPAAADAAIALGDSLAELRSSLRAASDEATVLTSPEQSVTVVTEALGQATEQLEAARASLRTLGKMLGVA